MPCSPSMKQMLLGAATTSRNPAPAVDSGFVIDDSFLLRFQFRRRQNGRHDLRLEPTASVRSVAEWFVVALAAAAQTDARATCQVVFVTGAIVDFDLALDSQRAVVAYGYFRRHRFNPINISPMLTSKSVSPGARLPALLRSLERVDRARRALLGQLIRIRLAVVVVSLVFYPCVHIDGVRQHCEDRKFMTALRTKDAVTFDCRHN